ncbi:MAG: ATP-binding protein [Akkermansiaceae bacterium]|nr:ATP-binding protein [Verrucomicrobiales bacterium]
MGRSILGSRRFAWLAFGLWLGGGSVSLALSSVSNYVTRTWQTDNGLPQSSVTSVVQTRDGYLWIGTYNGLARFDGVRFTVFDNNNTREIHSPGITALCETADGTLWIGQPGGELSSYQHGRFTSVEVRASWDGGAIRGLGVDENGDLWLMSENGLLLRMRDGLVTKTEPDPLRGQVAMARSEGGTIWMSRNGRLFQLVNGQLESRVPESGGQNSHVTGIAASRDGGLWAVVEERLRKWTGGKWSGDLGQAPSDRAGIETMLETADGRLAVATADHGFYVFQPGEGDTSLHFDRRSGFESDWVTSLCEDREGNLWVGTGGAGLHMLRTTSVRTLSPPDQWQGRSVCSVSAGRDGTLWVGTEGAGLYQYYQGHWENFGVNAGIENLYVWSIAEDPQGELWLGTWGGGLLQRRGSHFARAPGLEDAAQHIQAVQCGRKGGLWLGTRAGLFRYESGQATPFGQPLKPALPYVCAVVEDRDGTIWFGMSGGGLGCLKGGELRQFRKSDGLASDYVTCLYLDDGGALWVGTAGGGLNRLSQGRFTVVNRQKGLSNDNICHIEEDDSGYFWMSSHAGIIRASKAELEQCGDGLLNEVHCLTFGLSDGLPTLECVGGRQSAGCRAADGRLWFATTKGVVGIDPEGVRSNLLPPPVVIESLTVDGQPAIKGSDDTSLRIPPGRHRLEFQYAGLSFVAPEKVRFKYRLAGLANEWEKSGTVRSAIYTYIPPGNYTFQVIACNNDGVWNEAGAQLAFTVLPYFWQTFWFRFVAGTSLAMLAGGSVWFAMRRRMRRKLKHLESQRAIERERGRIAKDIHDDLGASLTFITLLTQSARSDLGSPNRVGEVLDRVHDTARDLTRAMDEIVWAVNPKHDTLDSLASYLSKFAQDYVRAARIRCSFDVPTSFPAWPITSELRHNLFLAFKEALHNVIKHAGASEVRIVLGVQAQDFTITIKDNGRGFASPAGADAAESDPDRIEHGNGIANMERRLSDIGGQCRIQSIPHAGTEVTFHLRLKTH